VVGCDVIAGVFDFGGSAGLLVLFCGGLFGLLVEFVGTELVVVAGSLSAILLSVLVVVGSLLSEKEAVVLSVAETSADSTGAVSSPHPAKDKITVIANKRMISFFIVMHLAFDTSLLYNIVRIIPMCKSLFFSQYSQLS